MKWNSILPLILGLLVAACHAPTASTSLGSLVLQVNSKAPRSILPSNLDSFGFQVQGTSVGGGALAVTNSTTGNFTLGNLVADTWTLQIDQLDSAQNVIATGKTSVVVAAGQVTNATISLTPPPGFGTLHLSASWPPSQLVDEVSGTLTSLSGSAMAVSLTVTGATADLVMSDLATGSYVLVLSPKSVGQNVAAPVTETVLIGKGKASTGAFVLSDGQFLPVYRHVTYDGNNNDGGILPIDSTSYVAGQLVSTALPGSLVKSGKVFGSWNDAKNGTGTKYSPGQNFVMPGRDVTLFAIWVDSGTIAVTVK